MADPRQVSRAMGLDGLKMCRCLHFRVEHKDGQGLCQHCQCRKYKEAP